MKSKLFLIIFCLSLFAPYALAANQPADKLFAIAYPAKKWHMTANMPGFVKDDEVSGDDALFAINESNNMSVGFIAGEAKKKGGADICRDDLWASFSKNTELEISKVKDWKFNNMYFKDYWIYTYEGETVNQKNLMGCFVDNGLWVIIQISKMDYKSRDLKLFTDVLRSIKTFDDAKYEQEIKGRTNAEEIKTSSSFQYLLKANKYFYDNDFKNAIIYYRKAYNLEKEKRTFGEMEWIVMIDNFGMSYGITKDYKRAQEVFEFGIKNYPTYPMFYYNLACSYAEQNNLPKTLNYLSLAYRYRQNMLPGETLPDPMTDDSFKGFLKNNEFLQMAKKFSNKTIK